MCSEVQIEKYKEQRQEHRTKSIKSIIIWMTFEFYSLRLLLFSFEWNELNSISRPKTYTLFKSLFIFFSSSSIDCHLWEWNMAQDNFRVAFNILIVFFSLTHSRVSCLSIVFMILFDQISNIVWMAIWRLVDFHVIVFFSPF